MRTAFRGYYRPTDNDFTALWHEADFVFDANALLNTYRYSDETARELLDLLKSFEARLWIPHRFGMEFHRNRCEVILQEAAHYEAVSKRLLEILESEFKSRRKHPFISREILERFDGLCHELETAMKASGEKHERLLNTDGYLDELAPLFDGRVGPAYSEVDEAKHHAAAKERYAKKIPPGYKDEKKAEPDRYGDYVAWRQILDHATQKKRPLILVTDDSKEDWWFQLQGVTIGPRPELIEEFHRATALSFYMYSVDEFMKHAGTHLGVKVPQEAIQEAKEQREKVIVHAASIKSEPVDSFSNPSEPKSESTDLKSRGRADEVIDIASPNQEKGG